METVQELQLQTKDEKKVHYSHRNSIVTQQSQHPILREYRRWLRVSFYMIFLVVGQCTATLLGRFYFNNGGNSKWMTTFVQSAGFPILLPLLFSFQKHTKLPNILINEPSKTKPQVFILVSLYLAFGLLLAVDNLMYSYGLLYLPLSTYVLLCATQLAFSALFSFFLNSQKFTKLILNSVVLLTISTCLLAVNSDDDDSMGHPKEKKVIGFFCTLVASATYSLFHSLVQLSFEKVLKSESFSTVLDMQLYPSIVATCACIVGLFASGEWKILGEEMKEYKNGAMSYIMTLVSSAVAYQIFSICMLGLIFEVSSLFSIVMGALELPIVPILAIIFFHDKINGVKIISLLIALWGFFSYMYQHYLDDKKAKAKDNSQVVSEGLVEYF